MTDFPHYEASSPGRDVTAVMGRRIAAWVVDLFIFIGLSAAMFAVQAEYVDLSNSTAAFGDACTQLQDQYGDLASGCFEVNDRAYIITGDESAVQSLASFGYLVIFVLLQGVAGGSPGKLLLGLRVVKEDGTKAGIGRSFVRTLLWIVDGAPWFAPLVGFIVGLTSTGHRRVGDLVARTYVIARKDTGVPVRTSAVTAPAGQPAWGAAPPPPQWPAPTTPPPQPVAHEPEPADLASGYWTAGSIAPSPSPTFGEPITPSPPGAEQGRAEQFPAEQFPAAPAPAEPPPLPSESTGWEASSPISEVSTPIDETPIEADTPSAESVTPADEAVPEVGADPDWYRGPEAEPSSFSPAEERAPEAPRTEPLVAAPDTSPPETWAPADPSTEWSSPSTPMPDVTTADDPSPSTGPAEFVAPGAATPPSQPPPAPAPRPTQPPSRSLPQVNQTPPPPQWDQARNTYIQWDLAQQAWLQWDSVANRWKPIDT